MTDLAANGRHCQKQVSQTGATRIVQNGGKECRRPFFEVHRRSVIRSEKVGYPRLILVTTPRRSKGSGFGIYLNSNKQYISANETPHLIVDICNDKQNGFNVEQVEAKELRSRSWQGSLSFHGRGLRDAMFDGRRHYFFPRSTSSFLWLSYSRRRDQTIASVAKNSQSAVPNCSL